MKEWVKELCPEIADWQAELIAEAAQKRVEAEREACAQVCAKADRYRGDYFAEIIRARGNP